MHLQLTGRLDPGESCAIIDFEGINPFYEHKQISVSLLNVVFCDQHEHTHFPEPVKARYPVDPDRYQETITVKRPRRNVFKHDDDEHHVAADSLQQRNRREVSSDLEPTQVIYFAGFRKVIADFVITEFKTHSPLTLIDNVLKPKQSVESMAHFQQLLHHPINYQLVEESDLPLGQRKVQITLPPLVRILCHDSNFFSLLGYDLDQLQKMPTRNIWFIENSERNNSKIFLAKKSVIPQLRFAFRLDTKKPAADSYTLNVQRLNPNFSSQLSLDTFCNKNAHATLRFFKLIVEGTVEILGLPIDSLEVKFLTNDVIVFEKAARLVNEFDSKDNFGLTIKLGSKIEDQLGLKQDTLFWSLLKYQVKIYPEIEHVEQDNCENIYQNLPILFLNQKSDHPIVQGWKERWQQHLADQEREKEQSQNLPPPPPQTTTPPPPEISGSGETNEEEAESTETPAEQNDNSREGGDALAVDIPTTATTSTTTEQSENSENNDDNDESGVVTPAVEPPNNEEGLNVVVESETSTNTTDLPPKVFVVDDDEDAAAAAAAAAVAAEPLEIDVVINNPDRRPPTEYIVANSIRQHICTNDPATFPENYTLIVREGEPLDYISTRGLCSVLGIVRKTGQPNVLSNKCVIRAAGGGGVKSLSVEIVDEFLNTFKNRGRKAMWIKLILKVDAVNANNLISPM